MSGPRGAAEVFNAAAYWAMRQDAGLDATDPRLTVSRASGRRAVRATVREPGGDVRSVPVSAVAPAALAEIAASEARLAELGRLEPTDQTRVRIEGERAFLEQLRAFVVQADRN